MSRFPTVRRSALLLAKGLAVIVSIPLFYLAAALVGGLIPANAGWRAPERGITIFVETNGVHTWISMPLVNDDMDWRPLAPVDHIRAPARAGDYVAIGYGNREFYLNTPEWKDLTVRRALAAGLGTGPSLVHVYHEPRPAPREDVRPIVLTDAQYHRLAGFIAASFRRDAGGHTVPLIGQGYGPTDVFYEANGRYNAIRTCNAWAGAALRAAGVRVGIWTPFSQSIMARF